MAALIGAEGGVEMVKGGDVDMIEESLDGIPLAMDQLVDFRQGDELDGEPLVCLCVHVHGLMW